MKYHVPPKATPGVPLCIFGNTNEQVMKEHGNFIVRCVCERVDLLLSVSIDDLSMLDSRGLVMFGFCDVVRVFIKNEPHNRLKVQQKRFRLISSVSLIDNLVQRLIFTPQDEVEILYWAGIPSKPGIGFDDDGVRKLLKYVSKQATGDVGEADISGWDWNVKDWQYDFESECRKALMGGPADALRRGHRLIDNVLYALSLSTFCFSDGTLCWQLERGLVKSGTKITSSTNSRMRVCLAYLIDAEWCVAMGDDSLENFEETSKAKYESLGFLIKTFERTSGSRFQFCSHQYSEGQAWPVDPSKLIYRYLSNQSLNRELFQQLVAELRSHPEFDHLLAVVVAAGGGCDNAPQEGH